MKRLILLALGFSFIFISCRSTEHPSQIGNRNKLDIYHRQKQVR